MTTRRTFLGGLAGILASGIAPAAAASGVLMPVRKIIVPRLFPMEIGRYEGFRIIESPMLPGEAWARGAVSTPEHRAAQRAMNRHYRAMLDNVHVANNPPLVIGGHRWTAP